MESVKVAVEPREQKGTTSSRRLRRGGSIPAVIYGLGRDPRHLAVGAHEMERLLYKGVHIVELSHGDDSQVALIKDVQWDALGSKMVHVDFQRIDREQKVHVNVPIRFVGEAPSVSGSVLERTREYVQVEVLPLSIPHEFVVNLSKVEVGDHVTIGDLGLPDGCEPYQCNDSDIVVTNHMKHKVADEEGEGEEAEDAPTEPEVIGKGGGSDESGDSPES